ncbi:hypothetical protein ILUMI_20190, partial [Ignelater luminosus]
MHQGQRKHRNERNKKPFHTSTVSRGRPCLFRDGIRDSDRCIKAQNLTLEERRTKVTNKMSGLLKKAFCYLMSYDCASSKPEEKTAPTTTIATQNRSHVLLQTITVNIIGSNESYKSRILLDSGAQKSYVKEDVAFSAGAMFVKAECLAQAGFGRSVTPLRPINVYKFTLQYLNGAINQEIKSMGQKKICEYVPKLHSGPWLHNGIRSVDSVDEMERLKIVATELLVNAKIELRMWKNTVVSHNENFPIGSSKEG